MPFLDVPSKSAGPSSVLLDQSPLSSGRPQLETPISFPGQGPASSGGTSNKLQAQTITPLASFLLKSSLLEEQSIFLPSEGTSTIFPARQKIFINVAHHHNVPAPPPTAGISPSPSVSLDSWVPGVVGSLSVTVDKAGNPSLLIDVIFASSVHLQMRKDPEYKLFIIQVVLEKVEEKLGVELSRDYSTPKTLSSKGPLLPRSVVLPLSPDLSNTSATSSKITELPPASTTAFNKATSSPSSPTSSVPRLHEPSTSLSTTSTSFTLTIHVPLVAGNITPVTLPPKTTLALLPPQTLSLEIAGVYLLKEDLGRGVHSEGLEAEWIVEKKEIRVCGQWR